MKYAAICLSGHLRSFKQCVETMKENLVRPLEESGYTVMFFVSTWDVIGNRSSWYSEKADFCALQEELNPVVIESEPFNRELFLSKFTSNKWHEYPHLSDWTTSGDAVCMYYKVQQCWNLAIEEEIKRGICFDIVVRTRPDLYMRTPLNTLCLQDNTVYMPQWHGRYEEINHTMVDYFALGTRDTMAKYMTIFSDIDRLITSNIPHTGEGFLYGCIQNYDLNVARLDNMRFGLYRPHGLELVEID